MRIEILGGDFLYAIRLRLLPGSFNLCPADYCALPGIADGVSGRGLLIENYDPPRELIAEAKRITAFRDGARRGRVVIGFDPFVDLVEFLLERTRAPVAVAS